MKSKCCNKPLRLSRENPEPGETMYYICDGCNQPADPKCDHSDLMMCNECTELEPAGDVAQVHLDQAQLHADDYVDKNYELPKELFCKCEHGTPCFDTCFEFKKYVEERVREEREKLITQLLIWTYTQTLSKEQLQHKGCGSHNGNNECCRNQTLELVRSKLNQLKGSDDN